MNNAQYKKFLWSFRIFGGNIFNKLEEQGKMGKIISVSLALFCRQFSPSNGLSFRSSGIFLEKKWCSALFFKPFLPPKIRNNQEN